MGGNSINLGDMMGGMMPNKTKHAPRQGEGSAQDPDCRGSRKADRSRTRCSEEAIRRAEQNGIVFLDEIDKIAGRSAGGHGPGRVSREGVQRDILPIVEGSTVNTKYGPVKHRFYALYRGGRVPCGQGDAI